MELTDALLELGWSWPASNKISCPGHSDSDPSLHLYKDGGFKCFSCGRHGFDGWGLLALAYDIPVGDLLRERGGGQGPKLRPRSRWAILDDLEARAWTIRWQFHQDLADLSGTRAGFYARLQAVEERFDYLFGTTWLARYFPEEESPVTMERTIKDIDQFYRGALEDERRLADMRRGL